METLLTYLNNAWLIFLVVMFFNVMIFVHELGHFLAGKWRGAHIDRFQIWFGKPIWKKTIGGVQYGLGWIPAGGFVSLPQLEDMQSVEGKADVPKDMKPLKAIDKIIIAAAGPLFSLLLAYFFACIVWFTGKPAADMGGTTVGYVTPDGPAAAAGLLPGDVITAVDGQKVEKWMGNMEGVKELIAMSEHDKITFDIDRKAADGTAQHLQLQCGYTLPETKWWQRGGMRRVGAMPATPCIVGKILPDSPALRAGLKPGQEIVSLNGAPVYTPYSVNEEAAKGQPVTLGVKNPDGTEGSVEITAEIPANWRGQEGARAILGFSWGQAEAATLEYPSPQAQVNQSLKWMGDTLAKVAAPGSSVGMEHLSGPVGIGNFLFRMLESDYGWLLILWFAVVLNVNLAVLNILPLPIVDGGHVVLGFAELVCGRPVSGKVLDAIQMGFLFLLFGFFLFVTFKDVGDMVGGGDAESKLPAPVFSPAAPQD